MLFWICPLMSLSSSCPLVLAEGNRSDTVALYSCILVLLTMGFIYLFIYSVYVDEILGFNVV